MGWLNRFRNVVRQEAQRATADLSLPRAGIVQNYDPVRHTVRVLLQPEGILTGYLPVKEAWVGNGWGMYAPPSPGQVVDVHFQQGGKEAGYVDGAFYSARTKPLACPAGEFWLVHQFGCVLKFTNGGKVLLGSTAEVDVGNLGATLHQLITDTFVALFNGHTHAGSAVPDQQMGSAQLTTVLKAN
jgi:hypothetical protein